MSNLSFARHSCRHWGWSDEQGYTLTSWGLHASVGGKKIKKWTVIEYHNKAYDKCHGRQWGKIMNFFIMHCLPTSFRVDELYPSHCKKCLWLELIRFAIEGFQRKIRRQYSASNTLNRIFQETHNLTQIVALKEDIWNCFMTSSHHP